MNWFRAHIVWSVVVVVSTTAILLILTDSFKAGIFALALAAAILVAARVAGAADKLLHVRSKSFDIALYLAFAACLMVLGLVIPTG